LDGNVFFESALENKNVYEDQEQAKEVKKMLKVLKRSADIPQITPFYAVLIMDGDSLGTQMSVLEKQEPITKGLKKFTRSVSGIVYDKNGFLIYAGGDDVLAVCPLEDAIDCALSLRQFYETCFSEKDVNTTLSGAIVYAHIKVPLTRVLKDAHKLLDEVAKDACGRDSLAIQVLKPGGVNVQWAMPWEKAWEETSDNEGSKRLILAAIADEFTRDDDKGGQFSSRFFYKIRKRFELLNAGDGSTEAILDPLTHGVDLMAADYLSSGLCDKIKNKNQRLFHARKVVAPLIDQCLPRFRDATNPGNPQYKEVGTINPDGAMIVRFLAYKGILS
jgi:CRISPR-associated protein Cmr2